jgi:hypothetical protein
MKDAKREYIKCLLEGRKEKVYENCLFPNQLRRELSILVSATILFNLIVFEFGDEVQGYVYILVKLHNSKLSG